MSPTSRVQHFGIVQRFNLARFFQGGAPSPAPWILERRNVYILPTRQGVFFAVTLLVILLGAINYSNSLGYFLTFLLASIGLLGMIYTYRNLLQLQIRLTPTEPAFANSQVRVTVVIDNPGSVTRHRVEVAFPGQAPQLCELEPRQHNRVSLYGPAGTRGWQKVGRFSVSTTYPLGLFRAWSHIVPQERYLVYPTPARDNRLPQASRYVASLMGDQGIGSDDFAGLRGYRSGDSLRHIHWKALAREQGLQTKQFGGDRSERLWLDWRMLEGLEGEARLSQLCRWVIEAERLDLEYGLWLPGEIIDPGRGTQHRQQCLRALALYG